MKENIGVINMIYILTAMYAEARAIITHFHLKKDISHIHFQVFDNQEVGIRLIVAGIGAISAAVAIADTCRAAEAGDFLVNVGICAGIQEEKVSEKGNDCLAKGALLSREPNQGENERICRIGEIFLCNKIREQITGRTFYPDILYPHGLKEAQILTGAAAYTKDKKKEGFWLYDMEAAAVYQAGLYYFGPHQMSFLKVVSDYGDAEKVTAEQVRELMEGNVERIAEYVNFLQEIGRKEQSGISFLEDVLLSETEKLCRDMYCSKTMAAALRQCIRYGILSGVDIAELRKEMYREGKLPCKDKREGKLCFEEFKRRVL